MLEFADHALLESACEAELFFTSFVFCVFAEVAPFFGDFGFAFCSEFFRFMTVVVISERLKAWAGNDDGCRHGRGVEFIWDTV